jgi:type I restriction enzyme R subunit
MPEYEDITKKFDEAFKGLKEITPTYQSVNDLESEEDEAAFVQAF